MRVDPASGLKVFDTRAAPDGNITGSGYGVLTDESLKVLPEQPAGAVFDAEEQAKYRAFKEARRGAADYMAMEGEFAKYLRGRLLGGPGAAGGADRRVRDPRRRCRVRRPAALAQAHAKRASTTSGSARRAATSAARGTGTAIPGIACDVESYSYLPLLEEMGYVPTMKFASGFEIFEYCQAMAERFGFYDHCLFHTTVERTEWDEDDRPLDGVHRPRRRDAGALRDPRQRHPHHPEAGAHRRHGDVRGRLVPHLAVELRRRSRMASGSGSSAPAPRPCRRSPSWPRSPASSTSSSARRRPSTCAISGRRRTRSATLGRTSPAGREPGAPGSPRSRQGRTAIQANDDYLAGKVAGLQGAQAARARADARGAGREAARLELPDHGADPRPGRRHRRGPEDGRGAEALLPVRLQAARRSTTSTCRRSTCRTCTSSTPRRWASRRSTSAAWSTTAWSTRSTC